MNFPNENITKYVPIVEYNNIIMLYNTHLVQQYNIILYYVICLNHKYIYMYSYTYNTYIYMGVIKLGE